MYKIRDGGGAWCLTERSDDGRIHGGHQHGGRVHDIANMEKREEGGFKKDWQIETSLETMQRICSQCARELEHVSTRQQLRIYVFHNTRKFCVSITFLYK